MRLNFVNFFGLEVRLDQAHHKHHLGLLVGGHGELQQVLALCNQLPLGGGV